MLIQPKSRILFESDIKGNSVHLSCKATGHPLPRYKWSLDLGVGLREINSTGEKGFRVDPENGDLFLINPDIMTHHGVYQCTAENPFGAVLSNTAFIEFGFLHPFPSKPRNHIIAQVGFAQVIPCQPPEHYPEGLEFQWYRNSILMNLTAKPDIFLSKEGDLYFSSPRFIDAGVYQCEVSHPKMPSVGGQMSPTIPMLVDRPATQSTFVKPQILANFPKFIKSTELPTTVMQIMLECVGEGSNLTYKWTRANKPLTNETHTLEDHGRRLLVYVGQNHTDKYNCTITGPLGSASKDLVLSLRELKPKRMAFSKELKDRDVKTGDPVTFECETTIKAMMSWYYNGQEFGPQMTNMPDAYKELITMKKTGEMSSMLKIKHASKETAGVYQCGAGDITRYIFSTAHLVVDKQYSSGGTTIGHDLGLIYAVAALVVFQIFAKHRV